MTFSSSTTNSVFNPGQISTSPPNQIRNNRDPTATDINANVGDEWENYAVTPSRFWKLGSVALGIANWQLFASGANILSISDTANTAVFPDSSGNIQLASTSANITITSAASSHKLNLSLAGLTQHSVLVGGSSSTIFSIPNGTTGQLLQANTGANPSWINASSGVNSVTGTAGQIVATPTVGDVIVSIDPTYIGQSSITTLGTITTGTWHGTVITGQYGGTGIANTGKTINLGSPTTGYVLTSDSSGNGTWQSNNSVFNLNGDAGTASGNTVTITGGSSGAFYTGSGSTMTTTFNYLTMTGTASSGVNGVITFAAPVLGVTSLIHTYGNFNALGGNNRNLFAGSLGSSKTPGNFSNTGRANIGIGDAGPLNALTSGQNNIGIGQSSLNALTSSSNNVAVGPSSLSNLISGSTNIGIGLSAGSAYTTSESSNILIGNSGMATESNVIRIGTQGSGAGQQNACVIAGIYGVSPSSPQIVTINSSGQLGSTAISPSGIITLNGDSGSATGSTVTITGGSSGAVYTGSGSTMTTTFNYLTMAATDTGVNGVITFAAPASGVKTIIHTYGNAGGVSNNRNFFAGSFGGGRGPGNFTNTGLLNIGIGDAGPLSSLTSGIGNIAFNNSLIKLSTGSSNIAIGGAVLNNLVTGSQCIALGLNAGISYTSSESSNILINYPGIAAESNAIHIGTQGSGAGQQNTCYIAGIVGVTTSNTQITTINSSTGQMGAVSTVALANGGTNANLTASNGGIFYSTATAGAILAGTATAGQLLLSGSSASPSWSTSTYPATNAVNTLLYASSANTMAALATGISGVLITSSGGAPSWLANGTAGFILTANSGAPPSWQTPAASSISITGDSGGALTGASFTFTASAIGLSFSGSGSTQTLGGTLKLGNGGTGANLSASNGGIFYSTATTGAILSGTATANQILLSGSSTTPAWSTATYPATTTINQLLYSSATNTISGISTANNGVLITSNSGVPSWLANSGTAGFVLTANSGAPPSWQASGGGGGGITTIAGDSGSATGSTVTITAGTSSRHCGVSVSFSGSSSTLTLNLSDSNANTALGNGSGSPSLTLGQNNISVGNLCLVSLTSGSNNQGYGVSALQNLITGGSNTAFGFNAGSAYTSSESNNIVIGNTGVISDSNVIRIGTSGSGTGQQNACYIAGITGATVTGAAVLCSTAGLLGTIASSRIYKENIIPIEDRSILDLRPVRFNYISDKEKTPSYGLIAEEVETIFPELVLYRDGKPDSIKYHEMPALLLNEIQKLKREIQELKTQR